MNRQSSNLIANTIQNLGFADREVRLLIGAGLISVMFVVPGPLGWFALAPLAAIPVIISAITGWDPIYALLRRNTRLGDESEIHQRSWSSSNMGALDRILRAVIGGAMIAPLALSVPVYGVAVMALFAIPLVMSAVIAWDPLYALARINTFSSKADVASVGPELDEQTLARVYDFAPVGKSQDSDYYPPRAA